MTNKIDQMCNETTTFDLPGVPRVHGCERPADHSGWHRDKSGASWIARMSATAHLSADLVAAYERGVAEGRRQAADAIRAEADNASVIEGGPDLLRWVAEIAECPRCPLGICSAHRSAEPVEEDAGRIQADVIRQAIAAIATLGPIPGERWMVELERFAQIVEAEGGSGG